MGNLTRLQNYDYSSNGPYFITITTHARDPILIDNVKTLVDSELHALSERFTGVSIDVAMIMPDHLHCILILSQSKSALPSVVQAFKSLTTRKIKAMSTIKRVWQRGYYERVIRDDDELQSIREYILNNPLIHAARAAGTR